MQSQILLAWIIECQHNRINIRKVVLPLLTGSLIPLMYIDTISLRSYWSSNTRTSKGNTERRINKWQVKSRKREVHRQDKSSAERSCSLKGIHCITAFFKYPTSIYSILNKSPWTLQNINHFIIRLKYARRHHVILISNRFCKTRRKHARWRKSRAKEEPVRACVMLRKEGESSVADEQWTWPEVGQGESSSEHGDYPPRDFWGTTDHRGIPRVSVCGFFAQLGPDIFRMRIALRMRGCADADVKLVDVIYAATEFKKTI